MKAIMAHARINGYEAPKKLDVRGAGIVAIQVTREVADGLGVTPTVPALPEAEPVAPPDTTLQ